MNKTEEMWYKHYKECNDIDYAQIERFDTKVQEDILRTKCLIGIIEKQKDRILQYIRDFGSISTKDAYRDLGITQLGARIDELQKEGYEFKKEWEASKNRYGDPVSYKKYSLVDDMIQENLEHVSM